MKAGEFEVVFAVPMECQHCVESVSDALKKVTGITKFDVNLKSNVVKTEGSAAPSEVVKAIQSIGKDAVIRGTGSPNSAAVCILESFDPKDIVQPVKGLARIVSVASDEIIVDLTVNGLPKGTYYPSIRQSGNLSQGALSTGGLHTALDAIDVSRPASVLTTINSLGAKSHQADDTYSGQAFLRAPLQINDLIGRSIILSKLRDKITPDSLCGVIARSAGVWENDKQVCSCSGKTLWQERQDSINKGLKT